MREITERQALGALRLLLGASAFAVAFDHTLAWLRDNDVGGVAGLVTAACIDVLAAVSLRWLLTSAYGSVRLLSAGGLAVSTVLSGLAQVHSNHHGGAGPWLSLVPLGAFAYLQLVHEVERRATRSVQPIPRPVRNRAAQPRPAVAQVAQPTAQPVAQSVAQPAQAIAQSKPPVVRPAQKPLRTLEPVRTQAEMARLAALDSLKADGQLPTAGQLSTGTGVSRSTCTNVLRELRKPRAVAEEAS